MSQLMICFLPHLLLFIVIGLPYSSANSNVIPMADPDMIQTICRTNDDPPACINILTSDPRSKTCDLAGLGRIALDLAKNVRAETWNYIDNLNAHTTDPRLHDIFNTCSYWYNNAKEYVDEAIEDLNSGAYAPMMENSGAVGQAGFVCEYAFKQPPTRPSPLTDRNKRMYCLGQIATAVGSILLLPLPPNP
ncbi:hypothetical protein ACLOJK_017764 [Asimina triloba]